MKIRRTCTCLLIAGGLLLLADGTAQAGQSKSGSQSDSTLGSQSGSPSGSSGSMKQGHEPSTKKGHEPSKGSMKQETNEPNKERQDPSDSPRCFGPPPSDSKDDSPATLKKEHSS